jgi:hypothetical protein
VDVAVRAGGFWALVPMGEEELRGVTSLALEFNQRAGDAELGRT